VADRGNRSVEELLDLAIELIADKGLAACSFRALAERAGTSTTVFTYRFESRMDLIRKVLDRAHSLAWADQGLEDLERECPVRGLYEIGLADLQLKSELEPYKRVYAEVLVAAPRDPELMETLREHDNEFLASYRVLIEQAQQSGAIDPDFDSETLALSIWATIDGLNINRYAFPDTLGPDELEFYFRRIFEGIIGRPVED